MARKCSEKAGQTSALLPPGRRRILAASIHGKTADILPVPALPAFSGGIGVLHADAGCHHPEYGHSYDCAQLPHPSAAAPSPGHRLHADGVRADTGLRMGLRQIGVAPHLPLRHLPVHVRLPALRPFHLRRHDDGLPCRPGHRRGVPDACGASGHPALLPRAPCSSTS